jgi:hypothetical protein
VRKERYGECSSDVFVCWIYYRTIQNFLTVPMLAADVEYVRVYRKLILLFPKYRFLFLSRDMKGKKRTHGVLVVKLEGKIPLGRPRRKWKDNIKMGFREIGWGGINWIYQLK